MSTFFLVNTVVVSGTKVFAGDTINDAVDDATAIAAAGGLLWPSSDAVVAAAAARAVSARLNRGANEEVIDAIMQAAVDAVQLAADASSVSTARTITAGAGLTGGGDLSANRTLDVVANADGSIIANANDVQVGILATDAQHGVRGGGTQHSAATGVANGFMTAADKAKLDTMQFGTDVLVAGVSAAIAANITANSRIQVTPKDKGASVTIGRLEAPSADRVVGAPGSFIVRSFTAAGLAEAADVSTFDWHVEN